MAGRHRRPRTRQPGRHRAEQHRQAWVAPAVVSVVVLAAGSVTAYAALYGTGGSDSPQPVPAVTRLTVVPTVSPTPTPTRATAAPTQRERPAPALALRISGPVSWVQVNRPDGHVLVSGLVHHGRTLVWRHGPLVVTVGNAGAVRADRHGHGYRTLGAPGQIARFTVR
jgi:hypothetical protein